MCSVMTARPRPTSRLIHHYPPAAGLTATGGAGQRVRGDRGMSEIDRMAHLSQTTYRLEMLWERCEQERQRGALDDATRDLLHNAVVENLAAIIAVIPDRPRLQRLPWLLYAVWFAIRRRRLDLALRAGRAIAA